MNKILTILTLVLILSSCGAKTENNKVLNSNLSGLSQDEIKNNINKLDEKGKVLVVEYFSSTDKNKKNELKIKIQKHMLEIQSEISNIKGETIKEKNREIQKITKKIKLYKSLGF